MALPECRRSEAPDSFSSSFVALGFYLGFDFVRFV
jgi:hypothetical protein